jgi:hypothetical protein
MKVIKNTKSDHETWSEFMTQKLSAAITMEIFLATTL